MKNGTADGQIFICFLYDYLNISADIGQISLFCAEKERTNLINNVIINV